MNEKSRIRFNPTTKEVEIEGSEAFVKTFFKKIQSLMSGLPQETTAEPMPVTVLPAKKGKKAPQAKALPPKKAGKAVKKKVGIARPKETLFDKIVGLIQDSRGITTGELQEKTGLTRKQIWSITYRAEKNGKIKRAKKGVYEAAG